VDFNGDGHQDIISGCYSAREPGMVAPVWVLYGTGEGDFEEAVALRNTDGAHVVLRDKDNAEMTERICTEPFAYDWDGDGDLDLLIGNFQGTFLLAMNTGTAKEPKFEGEPTLLQGADGKPLKITGVHSAPFLVDWDQDGDVDLLSGTSVGGALIAMNTAGEGEAPSFAAFETLIEPVRAAPRSPICAREATTHPAKSTRIWISDFDADGKLDVLLGDNRRLTHPKEGVTLEEARAKQKDVDAKMAPLRGEMDTLSAEMQAEEDADKKAELLAALREKQKALRDIYNERNTFVETVSTGYVWVYLQK